RVEGFDPLRGGGLDLLDDLCRCVVLGLNEENMNVIAHGIDFNQLNIEILERAGDVGMQLIPFRIAQQWAPVFGAENQMHDNVGKRLRHDRTVLSWWVIYPRRRFRSRVNWMCHGSALTGRRMIQHRLPRPSAWAITWRACGPRMRRRAIGEGCP